MGPRHCFICGSELFQSETRLGEAPNTTVVKSHESCPQGHYKHDYSNGHHCTWVGNQSFYAHNDFTSSNLLLTMKMINEALRSYRRWRRIKAVVAALAIPGGLIIVPVYMWLKKKKAQGKT